MQKQDRCFRTGSPDHRQIQLHAVNVQRQFLVSEASSICHVGDSFYRCPNV
ncbi:hypothetical protein D3C80_769010 [compost metagenome]